MGCKSGQVGCLRVSKEQDVCRTIIMLDCEGEGKKAKKKRCGFDYYSYVSKWE